MANLNPPTGGHEQESLSSKWLGKFYPALSKMLYEERIIGLEIGADYYEFKDPECLEGKTITIKVEVK